MTRRSDSDLPAAYAEGRRSAELDVRVSHINPAASAARLLAAAQREDALARAYRPVAPAEAAFHRGAGDVYADLAGLRDSERDLTGAVVACASCAGSGGTVGNLCAACGGAGKVYAAELLDAARCTGEYRVRCQLPVGHAGACSFRR